MDREDIDRHIAFLKDYAGKHGIIFRVTRTTISVEEVGEID